MLIIISLVLLLTIGRRAYLARKGPHKPIDFSIEQRMSGRARLLVGLLIFVAALFVSAFLAIVDLATTDQAHHQGYMFFVLLVCPIIVGMLAVVAFAVRFDFLKPQWCQPDAAVRLKAIESLDDCDILMKMRESDPDYLVGGAACNRFIDRFIASASDERIMTHIVDSVRKYQSDKASAHWENMPNVQIDHVTREICRRRPDIARRIHSATQFRDIRSTMAELLHCS